MSPKLAPLLVASILALPACATEADRAQVDTGAAAVALVRAAPDAAAEITTARFELVVDVVLDGESLALRTSGALDRPARRLALDLELPGILVGAGLAGADQPMQIVVDGDTTYLRVPLLEPITGTAGWLAADTATLAELSGAELFDPSASDPTSVLEVLRGVSDHIEVVAEEPIRGVATTHYRTDVDLDEALASAPEAARLLDGGAGSALADLQSVPVDVWLDGDGLLRRLVVTIAPAGGAGPPLTASFTLELYDYGAPVDIEVPPPAEVAPAGDVLGSMRDAWLEAGE